MSAAGWITIYYLPSVVKKIYILPKVVIILKDM